MLDSKDTPIGWSPLIKQGEDYRKEYGFDTEWYNFTQRYRGIHEGSVYPYNLIYGVAQALIPNLYFRLPYVNLIPTRSGVDATIKVRQHVANYLLREMEAKREGKIGILDCYLSGVFFAKLGFAREYKKRFKLFTKPKPRYDYDTTHKVGMPWMTRISPACISLPWGTQKLTDVPWIAHFMLKRVEDVNNDERYDEKIRKQIKGTRTPQLGNTARANLYNWVLKDAATEWIGLWEIQDYANDEIKVMAEGIDKWLVKEKNLLGCEGVSYADLRFNEHGDAFWVTPDVRYIMPQQLEMNEARTQAVYHRRVALIKVLVKKGILKEDAMRLLKSEEVAPIVEVDFTEGSIASNVQVLTPHIPPDLISWVNIIRADVFEMLGFSRNQLGQFDVGIEGGAPRRTATEAGIVQAANSIRMGARRDAVADFWCSIVDKVMDIIDSNWTDEQVVDVVGLDGYRYWVKYTPKELGGDYYSKVDMESMTPMTQALRRQELMQLIMTLGKTPGMNINYLINMLVKEFDYLDIQQMFPQSPATAQSPMSLGQFQTRERALAGGNIQYPTAQLKAGVAGLPQNTQMYST